MNCFSCHGGSVYGTPTPGAPNNRFALQTMTEEIRSTKFRLGKPMTRMDIGSLVIPLGTTNGTTNAVVFGMGLMSHRDEQLNVINSTPQSFVHHDMDAPPWWHFHKRPYIYIDGFAQKGHRALMQFMLVPENGPEFFRDNEDKFRDVFAYLSSLRAPKYPGPIDQQLAGQGRGVFQNHCAQCHWGQDLSQSTRSAGRDRYRSGAADSIDRGRPHQILARSWFAHAGEPDQHETDRRPRWVRGAAAGRCLGQSAVLSQRQCADAVACAESQRTTDRMETHRRRDRSTKRSVFRSKSSTRYRWANLMSRFAAVTLTRADSARATPGIISRRIEPGRKTAVLEYLKTL